MTYVVIDLETDGRETYKRFCNPLDLNNEEHKVICFQILQQGKEPIAIYKDKGFTQGELRETIEQYIVGYDIVIGHNIKFDLLWLWKHKDLFKGIKLWDTKTVDWVLEGQNKYIKYSLNECSSRYNIGQKIGEVSNEYRKGKLTSEIDKDLLIEYGIQDVVLTEKLFLRQYRKAKEQKQLDIIRIWNGALKCLIDMEYRGLYVNKEIYEQNYFKQLEKTNNLYDELQEQIKEHWPENIGEFNIDSPAQWGYLLFGGSYKYDNPILTTASTGRQFFKHDRGVYEFQPLSSSLKQLVTDGKVGLTKIGKRNVNKQVLMDAAKSHELPKLLMQYKKEHKLLTTYYKNPDNETGNMYLIHPHSGCFHSEFSISPVGSTLPPNTGRLSSKNPNVQNLPPTILDIFTSRYPEGFIVTADYQQLEVRIAANLSKDPMLIEEIMSGKDIHRRNAAVLFSKKEEDVTDYERKKAKELTFAVLYGAGSFKIAQVLNTSKEQAQMFIDKFYNKYIVLKAYYDKVMYDLERLPFDEQQKCRAGIYTSMFGKGYYFKQWINYRNEYVFKPSEGYDWPMQGGASIVVYSAMATLYKTIESSNYYNINLVNQVHDELVFDVECEKYLQPTIDIVKDCMENGYKEMLDYDWVVPFPVEIKVGKSLRECKGK